MRSITSCHPRTRIAVCLVLAAMLLSLVACGASEPLTPAETPAETEPVTLPDLTDDRVPTSVTAYADRLPTAFSGKEPAPASDFTYTVDESGVIITGYTGGEVVVVIPDRLEDKPVVSLAREAFAGQATLRALSIPDTVTNIAVGAMADCNALSTLRTPVAAAVGASHFGSLFDAASYETNASSVPNSLSTLILTGGNEIPDYAFYGCDFEVVFLPETVTNIGAFAFYGNDRLVHIPLGATALVSVGEHAFTNCGELLSLELPGTVTYMGFAMLEGCGKLETLTIPFVGSGTLGTDDAETDAETDEDETETALPSDHLGYIFGARAYVHSAGYIPAALIRVTLQAGCPDIPANAFFECSSIREIVIPDGVSTIGYRAFYGCAKLSTVALPDSVTTVGDDAFHGCIRLVDLTVGAGVTTLGVQVFMNCMSLETVTLPASVTYLPNAAFAGCRSLTTLTAPGVSEMGEQVFRHCDRLTEWTLGADHSITQ